MSDPIVSREEALRLGEGVTPGPWRWGGHRNGDIRLDSMASFRPCVMAFQRKGMQGAEPVFWDRTNYPSMPGASDYAPATERAVQEVEYRDDIVAIDVPDAALIASAPRLLSTVITLHEEVERLRQGLRQIVEGDYPADAGNAETWAQEILDRAESVRWQDDE